MDNKEIEQNLVSPFHAQYEFSFLQIQKNVQIKWIVLGIKQTTRTD